MNALSTPTLVMLALFALVATAAVVGPIVVIVRGALGRTVFTPPAQPGKAVLGFLERTFQDIVAGLLNGVEWLVYGA